MRRLVPPSRLAWWSLTAVNLALTAFPLMTPPGYELAEALSLSTALVGTALLVLWPIDDQPWAAFRWGLLRLAAAATPALLASAVRAEPCDPLAAWAFFPLLTGVTMVVSAALAAALSEEIDRPGRRLLALSVVVFVSAIATVWPLLAGPQVFAFNHLAGFFPGPLYDEALRVTPGLLWFRLASLLGALAVLGWAARTPALWVTAGLAFAALEHRGTRLGFRMSDEALRAELAGVKETTAAIIHYPAGMATGALERFVADVDFRHAQLTRFFGAAPTEKVTVWLYPSPAEKQRLVGASHTQFSKPWRHEVHVNDLGFPHPVLKHELVHAMAAGYGAGPFAVAATLGGLWPNVGVIEGLAVAGDDPIDELSLHEWAAAMKKQGLLPDVRTMLTPSGFYSAPPARAYTTAGSFLRWLGDTAGSATLRALYRDGDFLRATGRPLEPLVTEWEAFLDGLPLDEAAVNQAFGRFRRGSVFERPCAREVEVLAANAQVALRDDPPAALRALARCRALQPEEPSHRLAEVGALRRLDRAGEAATALDELLTRLEPSPAAWTDAALTRADLAIERGDVAIATALLTRILERAPAPAVDRTARVRLSALMAPAPIAEAVNLYFRAEVDDARKVHALTRALQTYPEDLTASYLLARRLFSSEAFGEAGALLERCLAGDQPASVRRETLRLALEAAHRRGDCDAAGRLRAAVPAAEVALGRRAAEWFERCEFGHRASPTHIE